MSTIFAANTPRLDATIRIRYYDAQPSSQSGTNEYRPVQLLEFHPDFDNRAKFRSVAYVKPEDWMEHPAYTRLGEGFLDHPYISVREFMIHEDDRKELMEWSQAQLNLRNRYTPLIIHPQLLPFPMFKKGTRVVVLAYKDEHDDTAEDAGQIGTITEESSPGGMSSVLLDDTERMRGLKSRGFPSIALREVKDQ